MQAWFERVVLGRAWLAFVVMGAAFLVFGAGTLSLFHLLKANLELIANHGWQALGDGAAQQLAELLATGYASLVAYLVFKACEARLVRRLTEPASASPSKGKTP